MTMQAARLDTRTLLAMRGTDAGTVLQGVVTNDVTALSPGRAVYTALLTPQGKYLFDFFLIEWDGAILIDIAGDSAPALTGRLKMYCLRRDARIEPGPDWQIAQVWGGRPPTPPDGLAIVDPRSDALGWRAYGHDLSQTLSGAGPLDAADLDALRVAHLVPETGRDLIADETYILETGFERLNGVDFRKGCYVGQEVTARMKHKTTLRKGLARVRIDGEAEPGTPIVTEDGRPAGTLGTIAGGFGLAHLRFDRARGVLRAGTAHLEADPGTLPG